MFEYTLEELQKLKISTDILRDLEGRCENVLTDKLLDQLVKRSSKIYKDEPNRLFEPTDCSLCGCMGPQNGEIYCPCRMSNLRYEYRYDIALKLVELNIVESFNEEIFNLGRKIKETLQEVLKKQQEEKRELTNTILDFHMKDRVK